MDTVKLDLEAKSNVLNPTFVPPPTPVLKRIGCGTGVSVYHYDRSPSNNAAQSPWALKKVNRQHVCSKLQDRIEREAAILKQLVHPNIIGFRGFTQTKDGRKVLAMEKCYLSLADAITNNLESNEKFASEEILLLIVGVAKALKYLHEIKGLIHGDIKSHNILINHNFKSVKLCDFGVSLDIKSASVDDYVGSAPWMPPEALLDGPITEKADIFSLGLTIWEMLTLKLPNVNEVDTDISVNSDVSEDETDDEHDEENYGETPELPEDLPPDFDLIKKIYVWCTRQDYRERPTARDILQLLSDNGIPLNTPTPSITL